MTLQVANVNKIDEEFLEETRRRIIKAYLPVIIIMRMSETTITSASDIISTIKKRYNIRISPGTVYPALYKLERNGKIMRLPNRIKNIFVLTEKGKEISEHFISRGNHYCESLADYFEILLAC